MSRWEIEAWYRADGSERPFRQRRVRCHLCKGSGKGEGCHEQGGWIMGLCPECCGHGGWMSNSEPVPGSRWRKTKRGALAVSRYNVGGSHAIPSGSIFTDPALEASRG